ncbi:MAG: winged helix-turn-helix transcriptional regulator [Thermoplasmata archaeon]
MADKSLAKALKRKIGLDEDILIKIEVRRGESSLLMNSSRLRIFEHVCNFPYSHLRAISRATGYSVQTVRWHLRKMMEGGLISESPRKGKKFYNTLKNLNIAQECEVFALLNSAEVRDIYLFIEKSPKRTQKELCKALDIYQQRLSRVLISLENSGLITHEKIGRGNIYFVTGKVKKLEDSFDSRSATLERALMNAIEADSLNPSIKSSDENSLQIKLDIGGGEGPILKINKNPLKALLRGQIKKTIPL